jgi:hypothetical protein
MFLRSFTTLFLLLIKSSVLFFQCSYSLNTKNFVVQLTKSSHVDWPQLEAPAGTSKSTAALPAVVESSSTPASAPSSSPASVAVTTVAPAAASASVMAAPAPSPKMAQVQPVSTASASLSPKSDSATPISAKPEPSSQSTVKPQPLAKSIETVVPPPRNNPPVLSAPSPVVPASRPLTVPAPALCSEPSSSSDSIDDPAVPMAPVNVDFDSLHTPLTRKMMSNDTLFELD